MGNGLEFYVITAHVGRITKLSKRLLTKRLHRTGAPNPPACRSPTQRDRDSLTTAQTVAGGGTMDDKCETCARTHSQLHTKEKTKKPPAFLDLWNQPAKPR